MAINKVVYGDQTLVDLTQDSVEASNLLEGETAHDRSGNPVTGTAKQGHIIQDADGNNVTQRNTVQFPDSKVEDDSTNGRTVVRNLQDSMTVSQFNEAQSLDPGIYPLEGGEVLDDSMIRHDANNTVRSKINALENKLNYSTEEHIVGKWIDGSDLYEKTVDIGVLPNATSKQVNHGINNLGTIVEIKGIAIRSSDNASKPLPFSDPTATKIISLETTSSVIYTETGTNYSAYNAWVTLRYTKS